MDHFVPYSSPYILCWHNNKDRMEDVTLFTGSQSTRNISDSNVSEVEKGRNEDLSSSNLVQISAGKLSLIRSLTGQIESD